MSWVEGSSYYGRPVLKQPVWKADIPAYLFVGGVMAGSSLLAAGADLTGNPALRRVARLAAVVGLGASTGLLVHDLGRPARFVNMLRVLKPTSPMSVGSWLLAAYAPPVTLAAASEVLRRAPAAGRAAGVAAAALAPGVATYTAVLIADTAVPAWHDAYRQLPLVFAGSALAGAGGLGLVAVAPADAGPARRLALLGAALELGAERRLEERAGLTAEPYWQGRAGRLGRAARVLTVAGALVALAGRRSRAAGAAGGLALLAGSACTRFAVVAAGRQSVADPTYTVVPQRRRLAGGGPVGAEGGEGAP